MRLDDGTRIVLLLTLVFVALYAIGYLWVSEDARYVNPGLVHAVAAVCALVSLGIAAASMKSYISTGYSPLLYLAGGYGSMAMTNASMTLVTADGNLFHWYLFFGYALGLALILLAGIRRDTERSEAVRVNQAALALLLLVVAFTLFAGLVYQHEMGLPAMINTEVEGQYFTPFAHMVSSIVLVLAAINTVVYYRLYSRTGQRITLAIATGALLVFESSAFHMVSQPANYFHWLFYALLALGLLQTGRGYLLAYLHAGRESMEARAQPQTTNTALRRTFRPANARERRKRGH